MRNTCRATFYERRTVLFVFHGVPRAKENRRGILPETEEKAREVTRSIFATAPGGSFVPELQKRKKKKNRKYVHFEFH